MRKVAAMGHWDEVQLQRVAEVGQGEVGGSATG